MEPLTAAESWNWCHIKSRIWGYSKISSREQMVFLFQEQLMRGKQLRTGMCVQAVSSADEGRLNVWVWWFKTRLLSLIWSNSSLWLLKLVQQLPFCSKPEPFLWVFAALPSTLPTESCWPRFHRKFSMWEPPGKVPFWPWEEADGRAATPWERAEMLRAPKHSTHCSSPA